MKMLKKYVLVVLLAPAMAFAQSGGDGAVTAAQTALTTAQGDGMSVGGYVIAAIGVVVLFTLVIKIFRKA